MTRVLLVAVITLGVVAAYVLGLARGVQLALELGDACGGRGYMVGTETRHTGSE